MMLVLLFGVVVEILLTRIAGLWQFMRIASFVPVATIGAWFGYSVLQAKDVWWYLLVAVSVFRVISLIKAAKKDIHPDYQRRIAKRTSLVLGLLTFIFALLFAYAPPIELSRAVAVIGFFQVVTAMMVLAVTARNLQKTQHHPTKHYYTDKELPTVTVAIPARNETDDLASCIRTVLANDYPKLEVLVLDDCSQDRTAEIIRDFAHDGVRFIEGEPPTDRWLAKNQAYEKLATHASGEIIVFCGVDVRFGPQAIRSLVSSTLSKKRLMMSVLPFRIGGGVNTSLVQPLRYWWELSLPRRLFNKPPVLSTCWLIQRKELSKLGRFAGVSHNILPERFFAREMVKKDAYAFIRSDEHLDIKTVKPVEEQLKTALRVKYPSLRKRPENVLILAIIELSLLLGPVLFATSWLWNGGSIAAALGIVATILLVITHYLIMSASHPLHSTIAFFNYPFAIVTELSLTLISMFRYEFGTVEWKGRNICIPTMHVVKKLPKI